MSTKVTSTILATGSEDSIGVQDIRSMRHLNIGRIWDTNDLFGGQGADGYQLGSRNKKTGLLGGLIATICALADNLALEIVWPEDRMVLIPLDTEEAFGTPNGNRRASAIELILKEFPTIYTVEGRYYADEPVLVLRDGETTLPEIRTIDFTKVSVRATVLPEAPNATDLFLLMSDHERNSHEPGDFGKWTMRVEALKLCAAEAGTQPCLVKRSEFEGFTGWSTGYVQSFLYLFCMPYADDHEEALRQIANGAKSKDVSGKLSNQQAHALFKLHDSGKIEERDKLYNTYMDGKKPVNGVRSIPRDKLALVMRDGLKSPLLKEGVRMSAGDAADLASIDKVLHDLGMAAVEGDKEKFLSFMMDIKLHHIQSQERQEAFLTAISSN